MRIAQKMKDMEKNRGKGERSVRKKTKENKKRRKYKIICKIISYEI